MSLQDPAGKISGRLMSLDALRGFDMFLIIGGTTIIKELVERTNSEGEVIFAESFGSSLSAILELQPKIEKAIAVIIG